MQGMPEVLTAEQKNLINIMMVPSQEEQAPEYKESVYSMDRVKKYSSELSQNNKGTFNGSTAFYFQPYNDDEI